jgi:beta-fructofuranosidase
MKIGRRNFLGLLIGTAALSVVRAEAQDRSLVAPSFSLASDPRRPQFHFLPAANWMNDPNGPIYWRGKYHLFYQYNPNGAFWGDMHWGHAISPDMVRWKHLPVALAPTPGGPDADGCFSGTAVVQDGQVVFLYTGVRSVPEAQATIKDGAHSFLEKQCLASTNDPELRTWTKQPDSVLSLPPADLDVTGFRDPSPWHQGDRWYMVIGSGIVSKGGAVLLYASKDLRHWEYLHILADRTSGVAVVPEKIEPREVWECPEFFALGKKHVLIYSAGGKSCWLSGNFNPETMVFHPEKSGTLDHGSFYAAKSQLSKDGQRILWGWIPETRKLEEYKASGWAGMMSLPRVLSLDNEGRLRVSMASEVEKLREKRYRLQLTENEEKNRLLIDALRIAGCTGEVRCRLRRSNEPFEFVLAGVNRDAESWLSLKYDQLHPNKIILDGKPLSLDLPQQVDLELAIYADGSVIEVLINDRVAYTKRFYYPGSSSREMHVQWTGKTSSLAQLSVWQLTPISTDRLTA